MSILVEKGRHAQVCRRRARKGPRKKMAREALIFVAVCWGPCQRHCGAESFGSTLRDGCRRLAFIPKRTNGHRAVPELDAAPRSWVFPASFRWPFCGSSAFRCAPSSSVPVAQQNVSRCPGPRGRGSSCTLQKSRHISRRMGEFYDLQRFILQGT